MNGAGKGDRYRPVDKKKYDTNWDKAFGKQACLWHICILCDKEFCNKRTVTYDPKFDC